MTQSFLSDTTSKNASIKREILRLCIIHNNYSIADFSKDLGISIPTTTKLIGELIDDNYLQDEGKSALRAEDGQAFTASTRMQAIS